MWLFAKIRDTIPRQAGGQIPAPLSAAFANLIGVTAGGFIGDAYLPSSYTSLRRAGDRTGAQMSTFAAGNVFEEFGPELSKLTRALTSKFHSEE